jgi:hypothetical protein
MPLPSCSRGYTAAACGWQADLRLVDGRCSARPQVRRFDDSLLRRSRLGAIASPEWFVGDLDRVADDPRPRARQGSRTRRARRQRPSESKPRSAQGAVSAAVRTSSGDRSWGQVRGFSGRVRVVRGRGAAGEQRTAVAGKRCKQALLLRPSPAARILHGKEAVPGSSPGEGLNTCKKAHFAKCRVPPDQGGARESARRSARARPKSPCKSVTVRALEHLRAEEGLDGLAAIGLIQSRWKTRRSASPLRPAPNVGDRFWGAERGRTVPHASNGAERGVRK